MSWLWDEEEEEQQLHLHRAATTPEFAVNISIIIIIMAAIIGLVVFMTRTKGFGMDSLFGNRADS
jgi:hypothetical protein